MSADSKYEVKVDEYLDCNGDPFCVESLELKAVKPTPIRAPITEDMRIGGADFTNSRITKGLYFDKRFKATIELQFPLKVNTIISTLSNGVKYYITKFVNRTKFNTFAYQVKRTDGSDIIQVDFNNLIKSGKVFVKGHYVETK